MDTFSVVRTQLVQQPYAASSTQGRAKAEVVGVLQQFTGEDGFVQAVKYREELIGLAEKLKQLGVQFSIQYGFEIQQTRTGVGVLGGTRSRLLNLSDYDAEMTVNDAFFGESPTDMVKRLLETERRNNHIRELEAENGIGDAGA